MVQVLIYITVKFEFIFAIIFIFQYKRQLCCRVISRYDEVHSYLPFTYNKAVDLLTTFLLLLCFLYSLVETSLQVN